MNPLNELENISEWKAMRQYAELTSKIKDSIIFGGQDSLEMMFDKPLSAEIINKLAEYDVKTTRVEQSNTYRFEF